MEQPPEQKYRMNSITGKQILSLIREGDFAHPGEAEAVQMLFNRITPDNGRTILDVGCGLGGTANLISELGLGKLTGLDIDMKSIEYAKLKYPEVNFYCTSASLAASTIHEKFDLFCFFNSLYTMPDQKAVLLEIAKLAQPAAQLLIFDYAVRSNDPRAEEYSKKYEGSLWNPLQVDKLEQLFDNSGWSICEITDITSDYARWYSWLVKRINDKRNEIIEISSSQWFEHTKMKYQNYADAAHSETVGGVIIKARLAGPSAGIIVSDSKFD